MSIRLLTTAEELRTYESWVSKHPHGNLWQSLAWKRLQEALGREVRIYAALNHEHIVASALVVIDRTMFGLSTWDIPQGPLALMESGKWKVENILGKILEDAKREKTLALYLSPHASFSIFHLPLSISNRHIYPEATRLIDLRPSEEEILNQMKPKGRYNIRLAEKHGVRVVQSTDVDAYASLSSKTGRRDGFIPQRAATYRKFLEVIPGSFLLLAYSSLPQPALSRVEGLPSLPSMPPLAGLLGLTWGKTGIYYYGASGNLHRELMAPYLLQWEAMKFCKAKKCTEYDLFGISSENQPHHPWASISDFKAKFGGRVEMYPPEQVIELRPLMKKLLDLKRKTIG